MNYNKIVINYKSITVTITVIKEQEAVAVLRCAVEIQWNAKKEIMGQYLP